MSFLQGLGSFAGGLDQTLGPLLQQYQQNVATGQGIASMFNGLSPAPQQSGLGSLMGNSAPPNVPVSAPSLGQGGVAQSPMPSQSPAPVTPPTLPTAAPALPSSQPMTANAGAQGVTPPSLQPPPQQTQQTAQLSPQLQNQQNQPAQQPDLSQHAGMFDFNTLMHNLVKTPGMTYEKLGRIANSRAFENMLNQQGLNQYRMLNLGLSADRNARGWDDLARKTEQGDRRLGQADSRQASLDKWRGQLETTRATLAASAIEARGISQDAQSRIAQINASVQRGDVTPEDAAKQIQAINEDRDKRLGEVNKKIGSLAVPSGEEQPQGDSAGPDVIYDNKSGKEYRYKGQGDRSDIKNYAPVQ